MSERPPLLPPVLFAALDDLRAALTRGHDVWARITPVLDGMAAIPPARVAEADGAIAAAAGLWPAWQRPRSFPLLRPDHASQLRTMPGLEHVFLCHRDGRLREAALHKLSGGLPNAAVVALLFWRLNDWAIPVRDAAILCARRCLPQTDASIVAGALVPLLPLRASWGRWDRGRDELTATLTRADVASAAADFIAGSTSGAMASALRHALHSTALDDWLEMLAFAAVQPAVRAVALDTLINGRAEWASGWIWRWVDKPMGIRRKETIFDSRPLAGGPRLDLIPRAVDDRSAFVRRVALSAVIRHQLNTPSGRRAAARLADDRSPSVRAKAAFILREA